MTAPDKIWAAARKHTGWKYAGCTDEPSTDCEPYHHQRVVDELVGALEAMNRLNYSNLSDQEMHREAKLGNEDAPPILAARALIAKHRKGGA